MKRAGSSIVLILLLATIPSIAQAKGISGTKCAKAGATANSSGTKYQCTKTSKGLIWTKANVSGKQTSTSTVSKLKQSINVTQVKNVDITTGEIQTAFSASSKLPVQLQTSTPLICAVQANSIELLQTGTCSIAASQAGSDGFLPAAPVMLTFDVIPPAITSDNALFDEVQTFIRVPKGTNYASDTAEISLTGFTNDATAKVCANDATADGCISSNGSGVADPASLTRYVEFAFHIKNLDANPLPTITYQLLSKGLLSDIDTGVTLQTLNDLTLQQNDSADGSFYGLVPKDMNLENSYLVINEGITDPSIRLLLDLTR